VFLEETIATCRECGGNGTAIAGSGLGKEPYPVVTYRCDRCGHLSNDPPNGSSFDYRAKPLFLQSIFAGFGPLLEWIFRGPRA